MMDNIGGRKFALAVLSLLSASILAYLGKIDASSYANVAMAIAGCFGAANVAEKVFAK